MIEMIEINFFKTQMVGTEVPSCCSHFLLSSKLSPGETRTCTSCLPGRKDALLHYTTYAVWSKATRPLRETHQHSSAYRDQAPADIGMKLVSWRSQQKRFKLQWRRASYLASRWCGFTSRLAIEIWSQQDNYESISDLIFDIVVHHSKQTRTSCPRFNSVAGVSSFLTKRCHHSYH